MSKHDIDAHVGKRLKARRTIMGLSQEAVAKAVGVTFQQVQKYEKGTNAMNANRLFEFSHFMHVPVAYFFEGMDEVAAPIVQNVGVQSVGFAETPAATFEHNFAVSDRESLEMMKAFNRISEPVVRRRLADLVRAIADKKTFLD